jgi:signal transduction histidine kinase
MARALEDRNAMLLEAAVALSSELSLPAVLQRIVDLAARVTGARYAALGVLGPGGELIAEFITIGVSDEQRAAIGHTPVGRGVLGVLIHDATPLRLHEISEDPRSVGFPPNHPEMHSFLGAPVKAHGRVFGNIYLTEKQGARDFDDKDERALLALATQAGVAIENAQLYEEVRRHERWLAAIHDVTTSILSGVDVQTMLELVARLARELVEADLATIAVPDDGSTTLVIRVADGRHAEALRGLTVPEDESISGEVIRTGKPVILADASAGDRAYQPMIRTGEIGPAIFVPLVRESRPFGTLAVANRLGAEPFIDRDVELVKNFADQASVALEYARAQAELHRLVVMEDRERIAKELHDGVIQSLFAVGMGLQATATLSPNEELQRRVESAVNEIDRAIRDLRNFIFGLRPGILADRQLDQALRTLAEDFQEKAGVTTAIDIDARVAAELAGRASDVVQLTREALSNVGRHAEATTCRVSLFRTAEGAVLEIDDDGRGFNPGAPRTGGHGLRNIRERCAALGGAVQIQSTPGDGTTLRITLPL